MSLPLIHGLGRGRTDYRQVGQTSREDDGDGGQHAPSVGRFQDTGDPRGDAAGAAPRVGQGHDHREGGLHGKVNGENVGHQGGELGTGEDPEGDDPADEGLQDEVLVGGMITRGSWWYCLREKRCFPGACHS